MFFSKKKKEKSAEELIFKIKKIPFQEIEIKSNNYWEEEIIEKNDRAASLNYLSGNEMDNVRQKEVNISVIVYVSPNGKKYVSKPINKDYATMMFKLEHLKFIDLYISQSDSNSYFFDLSPLL